VRALLAFLLLAAGTGCALPGTVRTVPPPPTPPPEVRPAPTPAPPPPAPVPEAPVREKPRLLEEEAKTDRERAAAITGYRGDGELLLFSSPSLQPLVAGRGERIEQRFDYTILFPDPARPVTVIEKVVIAGPQGILADLVSREVVKEQGTHTSRMRFILPADLEPGEYRLITILEAGRQKKNLTQGFRVGP
jgi:hypothetical protein